MPTDAAHKHAPLYRGLLLLAVIAGATFFGLRLVNAPETPLIRDTPEAKWMRVPSEPFLGMYEAQPYGVTFAREFTIEEDAQPPTLTVRAARKAEVWIGTTPIYAEEATRPDWNHDRDISIQPEFPPGTYTMYIRVTNDMGLPLLRVESNHPALRSGTSWYFTPDGEAEYPVELALAREPFVLDPDLPSATAVLQRWWFVPLGAWTLLSGVCWWLPSKREHLHVMSERVRPSWWRFGIYGLFTALLMNNWAKLQPFLGMDANHHLAYMGHLVDTRSLPPLNSIPQAFQAPLYYMLGAPLEGTLRDVMTPGGVERTIALGSLLCGLIILELTFRVLRRVYPGRVDLHLAGTALTASLPIVVLISHFVSNETLVGVMGSALLLLCFRHAGHEPKNPRRAAIWLGVFFGLAILSKTTAVLLLPALVYTVLSWYPLRLESVKRAGKIAVPLVIAAALTGGWFYVRNQAVYGTPFVGGWSADTGFAWWQYPSYRVPDDYLRMGSVFRYPLYAGMNGFWDGLYSTFWTDGLYSGNNPRTGPGWNIAPLFLLVWLALLPMAALLIGAWRTGVAWLVSRTKATTEDHALRLSLMTVTTYLAAMLWHHVQVPLYSNAKGTYFLSATPCIVLLILHGARPLLDRTRTRPFVWAAIAVWFLAVYTAFFIPYDYTDDPRLYRAAVQTETETQP